MKIFEYESSAMKRKSRAVVLPQLSIPLSFDENNFDVMLDISSDYDCPVILPMYEDAIGFSYITIAKWNKYQSNIWKDIYIVRFHCVTYMIRTKKWNFIYKNWMSYLDWTDSLTHILAYRYFSKNGNFFKI